VAPSRPVVARLRALAGRVTDLPGVSSLAASQRRKRWIRSIRHSGLFDEDHYRRQLGDGFPSDADPVDHYVRWGAALDLTPHPLFDPRHYLETSPQAQASRAVAFVEFLERGCHRGDDPHPLFDTAAYLEQAPRAREHPYGAFGHYLEVGASTGVWPSRDLRGLDLHDAGPEDPYVNAVADAIVEQAAADAVPEFHYSFEEFDHRAAQDFLARMQQIASELEHRPLVSVVLPTRDRADVLPAAIESVLSQTWPELELIVVDDGGTDGTREVVEGYGDPRLRYVWQENQGVSGARNRGLREAHGELIAYLDSDNTWKPEFLEVMVAFLRSEGLRAGYSASELHGSDRLEYRGQPLDRLALQRQNYIDCIVFVHDADLVAEIGGFDERLRRVVDWDLLLRMAAVTDLGYAPFIGTSYDVWEERADRITRHESSGYRWVVRDKHLVEWEDAPPIAAGRLSLVLTAREPFDVVVDRLRQLHDALVDVDHEVLVVDRGLGRPELLRLRMLVSLLPSVELLSLGERLSGPVARNLGAARASGDVLVFLDAAARFDEGALTCLADEVRRSGRVLLQPTLLHRDDTIRSTGQLLAPRVAAVVAGAGLAADDCSLRRERAGVDGHAFAVDAVTMRRLGGTDPLFVRGGGDLDLGLRALEAGAEVRWLPEARALIDPRQLGDKWSPSAADRRELVRRWLERGRDLLSPPPAPDLVVVGMTPVPGEPREAPVRWAHVLTTRPRGQRVRRWALKVDAPRDERADLLGRVRLLATGLQTLGEHVVIDRSRAWYRDTAHLEDVDVVITTGARSFEPTPGRLALRWLVEDGDDAPWEELVRHDRVLCASSEQERRLLARHPDVTTRVVGRLPTRDGRDADAIARQSAERLLAVLEELDRD
jgi:glycosyltransferase involved in cell wall biosynthesis